MIESTPWTPLPRYTVLDESAERFFDHLTQLAAQACNAPVAVMSLVDEDQQRYGSNFGLAPTLGEPPEIAFCARTDFGPEPLWVEDAEQDERFGGLPHLPCVPRLRFFARVPLQTSAGVPLGALCVIDRCPRLITALQFDALRLLAAQTVQQLELRRAADGLRRRTEQLERTQAIAHIGGWELDAATQHLTWTSEIYRIHGVTPADYTPTVESAIAFHTPPSALAFRNALHAALHQAAPCDLQAEIIGSDGVHRWLRITGHCEALRGRPHRIFGVVQDITERRQLESEILLIAQREQQRIGFDLHDGLGQELTGVSLLLHNVTARLPEALAVFREELIRVEGLVRNAVGTCRLLAHGLSPVSQERGGLLYALQMLASQIDQLHGIKVTVTARGAEPELDEAAADHLYRMVQEALTNAIRHAMPRELEVVLEATPADLTLTVTDDGIGIALGGAAAGKGMGLRIMRYRARLIGAALSVERRPEGGTRVTYRLANLTPLAMPGTISALE